MKKKLEAELISIAHRILRLKDKSTLPQLQEEARQLYEKLTILTFTESHFSGPQPTIGQVKAALDDDQESVELSEVRQKIKEIINPKPVEEIKPELEQSISKQSEAENVEEYKNNKGDKPELIIEEINARVTEDLFVPANSTHEESTLFSEQVYEKNDKGDIAGDFQKTTASNIIKDDEGKPKSLNDQLRKDIHIGLNDRLAFIKYLFEGSTTDYNRVLSQLETFSDKKEAQEFINNMVKPDYHQWEGKTEYEERFMDIVLSKFEH